MKTIETKQELAEFFRDKLLPYYENHYREDLTKDEADELGLNWGVCYCSDFTFNISIWEIVKGLLIGSFICFTMVEGATPEQALLPRIEWMKNFINENLK